MTLNYTVGFLGYGNIAQAVSQGLIHTNVIDSSHIIACAAHYEQLQARMDTIGAQAVRTAQEVVQAADIVCIAVKPHQVEAVVAPLLATLRALHVPLVSLAAGWTVERYRQCFGSDLQVQCAIPNTPIAVGKGILITEEAHSLSEQQTALFHALFSPIALIERVASSYMNIAMYLAGCAPAFMAMAVEALADAGVKHGLQRACAYRLAAAMTEGTGALISAHHEHPGIIKDAVCSPGGSTIRAVCALEKAGLRAAFIRAIDAIEQ